MTTSDLSSFRLFRRQFLAHLPPWLSMALIVFTLSFFATIPSPALESMAVAEVSHQLDQLSGSQRLLLGTATGKPLVTPKTAEITSTAEALEALRQDVDAPLRDALQSPWLIARSDAIPLQRTDSDDSSLSTKVAITVAPGFADHVRLTAGSLPAQFTQVDAGVEVVLSTESAAALKWTVGETRTIGLSESKFPATLSGTFDAVSESEDYWALDHGALKPSTAGSFINQVQTKFVTAAVFIDPQSFLVFNQARRLDFTTTVAFPLSVASLNSSEMKELTAQLERFSSADVSLATRHDNDTAWQFSFESSAGSAIERAQVIVATSVSVMALVASGPLGVGAATVLLLSQLIVRGRQQSLALLRARGSSMAQLRAWLAAECLAVCLPAAALAAAAAWALAPGQAPATQGAFAIAVVVTLVLVATLNQRSLRVGRIESTSATTALGDRAKVRITVEMLVLGATALSLTLLAQRGLTTNALDVSVDPLLVAAPLLAAISVGLLVLRIYPLLLALTTPSLRARRRFTTFFGVVRAARDPSIGATAILALVIGLSITIFSLVSFETLQRGVTSASDAAVGADLRIDSVGMTAEQLSELGKVDGVKHVVGVQQLGGSIKVAEHGTKSRIAVLVADTAALARVQAGIPSSPRYDGDLTKLRGAAIPAVFSAGIPTRGDESSGLTVGGLPVVNAATTASGTALSSKTEWMLIDTAFMKTLDQGEFLPQTALVSLNDGADSEAVRQSAATIFGDGASFKTQQLVAQQVQGSPVVTGLQTALVVSAVITGMLCSFTIMLSLLLGSRTRSRLLALLTVLGLSRGQGQRMIAWEIAPPVICSLAFASALGVILPHVILSGIDLTPFTGGLVQPVIQVDPLLVLMVASGFAAIAAIATLGVTVTQFNSKSRKLPISDLAGR